MSPRTYRWHAAVLFALVATGTPLTSLTAQAQQQGAAAAGTLQLNNVAAPARDAFFASLDALHRWDFLGAYEQASRALAADSTFALARAYKTSLGLAPTADALNAEWKRAIADASARPAGEAAYVMAIRTGGLNGNRFFAVARAVFPNDRRIALEHAVSFIGETRLDSLRSLVKQYPDLLGAKLWLAYYLTNAPYLATPAENYEGLTVAWDAVRQAPDVAASHAVLGHVLQRLGRDDEAVAHLQAATKMDSRMEYAYTVESEIFARDGKPRHIERARAALDSAIAVTPHVGRRLTHRTARALVAMYDGNTATTNSELSAIAKEYEAAGNSNAAAVVYSQLAGIAAGTGDAAGVDNWMKEATRVSGPNTNISVQATQAYALNKQGAEARKAFDDYERRVTDKTTPTYQTDHNRLLGMVLYAEGKPAEAVAALKRSDAAQNTFTESALADAYTALKDQKNADAARASQLARHGAYNSAISMAIAQYRAAKKK